MMQTMNHEAFLKRLNRIATRFGIAAITTRQLRRWAEAKNALLTGPTAKGIKRGTSPDWQWSREDYRKAVMICCLMSRGIERFANIRAHLWLSSSEPLTRKIRPGILLEFSRIRKYTFRKFISDKGPDFGSHENIKRQENLTRKMGLEIHDQLSRKQIISFIDTMRFGSANVPLEVSTSTPVEKLPLPKVLRVLVSEIVDQIPLPGWPALSGADISEIFLEMASGLAGESQSEKEAVYSQELEPDDEMPWTAEQTLERAPPKSFIAARQLLQVLPWIIRSAPNFIAASRPEKTLDIVFNPICERIAGQVENGTRRLAAYVQILHWIFRQKNKGIEFAQSSYEVVPILRRIIARSKIDPEIRIKLKSDNPFAPLVLLMKPNSEMFVPELKLCNWLRQRLRNHGLTDLDQWRHRWSHGN